MTPQVPGDRMGVRELERRYAASSPRGCFFDRATLKWFGSAERRASWTEGGYIVYSELQTNAPIQPWWSATLFSAEGEMVGQSKYGDTRQAAVEALLTNVLDEELKGAK